MEEQANKITKKRLSPEATMLLTIGGFALIIILVAVVHFIITGA